jgi:hypothetical protein
VAAVTVKCAGCGKRWEVPPKPDGSMPQTARCPRAQGGCGKLRKVPARVTAPERAAAAPSPAATWDPQSEPRKHRKCDEPCPHCGAQKVYADQRGIARVCMACGRKVTPPGVLAPYERGAEVTRAAKSQRERDLEALGLAGRKGLMLGELRRLAADDRLDDASVMKVEWFAEQVKAAASGARLDDLADLFAAERIKPRGWFQRPVAITAGYAEDDDEDDEDQDDEPAALATPAAIAAQQHRAQPKRMTWAEAIAACGWRLSATIGGCQIVNEQSRLCGQETAHHIGIGWICATHYGTLGGVIWDDYRQQRSA